MGKKAGVLEMYRNESKCRLLLCNTFKLSNIDCSLFGIHWGTERLKKNSYDGPW